jgi:hypothetical protein
VSGPQVGTDTFAIPNRRDLELRHFITESLKQIVGGVVDAQGYVQEKGGSINPGVNGLPNRSWEMQTGTHVQEVDFDVAVTATEDREMKGGIGALAGFLALGSQGKTDKSNIALTRLRFTIPIALPSRQLHEP